MDGSVVPGEQSPTREGRPLCSRLDVSLLSSEAVVTTEVSRRSSRVYPADAIDRG